MKILAIKSIKNIDACTEKFIYFMIVQNLLHLPNALCWQEQLTL